MKCKFKRDYMINAADLSNSISLSLGRLEDMLNIENTTFINEYSSKIDHIAFIVQSSEKYNAVVQEWISKGFKEYFTDFAGGENEETGTKVGVYKMAIPIKLGESLVEIIEVIMPNISKRKNDDSFEFDHFEVSIGDKKYPELMKEFPNVKWLDHKANRSKYPHLFIEGLDHLKFVQGSILDNM